MAKKKNEIVTRIFDELTGERIFDPDLDAGRLYTEQNPIESRYIATQEEVSEIIPNPDIPPKPNGSRIMMKKIIKPEKGAWHTYDFRGGEEREITEDIGVVIDPNTPHELVIPNVEQIQIYHTYTQEELEEMARQEAQRQEQAQQSAVREAFITNMMNNDALVALVSQDQVSTETYETLTQGNATIKNTEPFSQAYARRVNRKEVKVADCPVELQERIIEIIDNNTLCSFTADINNGIFTSGEDTTTQIKQDIPRFQTVTLLIIANEGYRVPTMEEVADKIKFSAQDDDAKVLEDYFNTYCSYNTTNQETTAVLRIPITEEAATIATSIDCPKISLKKKKK